MEKPFPEQSPADFGKGQSSQPRSHHLHAVSIIPGKFYLPFPWVKASVLCTQELCRGFFPLPAQFVLKPCSKKGIFHQSLEQQVSPAKCEAGHSPPSQLFTPSVSCQDRDKGWPWGPGGGGCCSLCVPAAPFPHSQASTHLPHSRSTIPSSRSSRMESQRFMYSAIFMCSQEGLRRENSTTHKSLHL